MASKHVMAQLMPLLRASPQKLQVWPFLTTLQVVPQRPFTLARQLYASRGVNTTMWTGNVIPGERVLIEGQMDGKLLVAGTLLSERHVTVLAASAARGRRTIAACVERLGKPAFVASAVHGEVPAHGVPPVVPRRERWGARAAQGGSKGTQSVAHPMYVDEAMNMGKLDSHDAVGPTGMQPLLGEGALQRRGPDGYGRKGIGGSQRCFRSFAPQSSWGAQPPWWNRPEHPQP